MPSTISVLDSNKDPVEVATLDAIADILGAVTANPSAYTLLGRLKALADISGEVSPIPTANTILDRLLKLATLIGEVQASPTENTVLDRLKDLAVLLGEISATPTANTIADRLRTLSTLIGEVQASPTANTLADRLKTLSTQIGEVQASPTENTVLDRLKDIATALAAAITVSDGSGAMTVDGSVALLTGSAIIGRVGIDQTAPGTTDSVTVKSTAYESQVSTTRPSNQTPYTAGDAVGAASAIITFPSVGPAAGNILITSVDLRIDIASVTSGMTTFRLHLYNAAPTAIADNAAFDLVAGDRAGYLGYIDLVTPVDLGSTLVSQTGSINRQVKLASTSLYGILTTVGGFTPAAVSEVYTLRIRTVAV